MMQRPITIAACFCLALGLTLGSASAVRAQEDPAAVSYITPFPVGDVYRTIVVGDSFAEGALAGLLETFGSDSRLQMMRRHRALTGLVRAEVEDDFKALEDALTREPAQITVVMLGRDDRAPIRVPGGKRLQVSRDDWRDEYGRRADLLMKLLKRRGGAVYWIGLPVLRKSDWNDDIQVMNDLVRDRASLNGIKYIDAFAGFADEGGNYIAEGPDAAGRIRTMRTPDGIGFTEAGNHKLAHFVEREIKRDLTQAKNERSIPLAGAEVEQRKINPAKATADSAQAAIANAAAPKLGDTKSSWALTTNIAPQPAPLAPSTATEQKADNTRISLRTVTPGGREETATLEILRPAISASVIQLLARNASPDRAAQVGDTLQESLPGGLLLLSSISLSSEGLTAGRRARLAPTQTAFFKVMIRGERVPPRPGRSDDFRWPRPDQMPEPVPVAAKPAVTPVAAPVAPQPKTVTGSGQRQPATPKAIPPRP